MEDTSSKGLCCPISGCPIKCLLGWTFIAFIVIFLFEGIFHGVYMKPAYEATLELWRSNEEMQNLMHFSVISQLLRAFFFSALYGFAIKGGACSGGDIGKGIKFGLMAGCMVGAINIGAYAYMPLPLEIPISWMVGEVIMGTIVGFALGAVSHLCNKRKAS